MSHAWAFCLPPVTSAPRRGCADVSQSASRPAALHARVHRTPAHTATARSRAAGAAVAASATAAAPLPGKVETAPFILGWPCDFPAHYMLGRHLGTGACCRPSSPQDLPKATEFHGVRSARTPPWRLTPRDRGPVRVARGVQRLQSTRGRLPSPSLLVAKLTV